MRKKGALLLAALLILLSACSASPTSTASPAKATPIISGDVLLPNGLLPSTTYEPASQPARYSEEVTKALIPRSDYGHIWPYVGAFYMTWSGREVLYGLCDEKGRVICDPVYNEVQILEKDGVKLYELIAYQRLGTETRKKFSKITLARPDGSWAEVYDEIKTVSTATEYPPEQIFNTPTTSNYETDNSFSWRAAVTNDYITVRKGNKWGAVDYSGKEILPCVYSAPLCFSEGLAAIVSDDGKEIRFIDSTGKPVLGPFTTPPMQINFFGGDWGESKVEMPLNYGLLFSEGKVRFYKDGKFGVIDKNGNVLVEAKHDYISSYSGGTAIFVSGGKYGVLGTKGEVLLDPADKNFSNGGNGTVIINEKGGKISLNLFTGERKPFSNSIVHNYTYTNGGVTLTLKNGEQRFYMNSQISELKSENYLLSINDSNPTWKIINPNGDTVAGPFDGRANYKAIERIIYVEMGKPYDYRTYDYWTTIYDETGKRLLPGEYLSIQPFNDCYMVQTNTVSGLLDKNGSWVIKVPLYEYMGD